MIEKVEVGERDIGSASYSLHGVVPLLHADQIELHPQVECLLNFHRARVGQRGGRAIYALRPHGDQEVEAKPHECREEKTSSISKLLTDPIHSRPHVITRPPTQPHDVHKRVQYARIEQRQHVPH